MLVWQDLISDNADAVAKFKDQKKTWAWVSGVGLAFVAEELKSTLQGLLRVRIWDVIPRV